MSKKHNKEYLSIEDRFNENVPLAKFYCKRFYTETKKKLIEYDDFYQLCLIGLWKASQKFNGNEETWPTLVFNYIRSEISNEIRTMFCQKRKGDCETTSLDLEYEDGRPVYQFYKSYDFDRLIVAKEVDKNVNKLSSKQKDVLYKKYWLNQSCGEISKDIGITREGVRQMIVKCESILKPKLKKIV